MKAFALAVMLCLAAFARCVAMECSIALSSDGGEDPEYSAVFRYCGAGNGEARFSGRLSYGVLNGCVDFRLDKAGFEGMAGQGKLVNGLAIKAAPHSGLLDCGRAGLPVGPDAGSSRTAFALGVEHFSLFAILDSRASADSQNDVGAGSPSWQDRFGALGMQCGAAMAGLELSAALSAAFNPGPVRGDVLGRGGESLWGGCAARYRTDGVKAALWGSARVGHFAAPGTAFSLEAEIPWAFVETGAPVPTAGAALRSTGEKAGRNTASLEFAPRFFLFAASRDYRCVDGSEPAYDFLSRVDVALRAGTWSAEAGLSAASAFGAPVPTLRVRNDADFFRKMAWYLSIDSIFVSACWKGFGAALSSAAKFDPRGVGGLRFSAGYGLRLGASSPLKADFEARLSLLRKGSAEDEAGEGDSGAAENEEGDSAAHPPEGNGMLAFSSLRLKLKGEWDFHASDSWLGAGQVSVAVRVGSGDGGAVSADIAMRQDFRFGKAIMASLRIASPSGGIGKGKLTWPAISLSCRVGIKP